MFHILDGSENNILGVEISGGYTKADVEAFNEAATKVMDAGYDKINILVKMDQMHYLESEFMAFINDARSALKYLDKFRHLAIVGDSKIEAALIKVDNMIFGSKVKERIEKYFMIDDLDKAWDFVRS